ncbi:MAG: hypothetical protein IPP57_25595 [Candidatus Obscuribacter sp.]|nr:hypothetical protein [Candidatus Obscuribacter sp.]MBK9620806.1 hypothetical protein [Candidatus Obscuribacter sp.]MBK9774153.1 hypothetical protein [Candidatus Obscuribacter sp.]
MQLFKRRVNLDNVAISAPCPAIWQDMDGDDRVRACSMCKLNVYNISEMTRFEAETFIANNEGHHLCIKLSRRSDGTIITRDCPLGRRMVEQVKTRTRIALLALFGLFNCSPAWTQQLGAVNSVDKFGWFVDTRASQIGPPSRGRIVAGRIGESGGALVADTDVVSLYSKAMEFESYQNPHMAAATYDRAIKLMRLRRASYDPKFVKLVASSYVKLLVRNKDKKLAKEIKKEFYR